MTATQIENILERLARIEQNQMDMKEQFDQRQRTIEDRVLVVETQLPLWIDKVDEKLATIIAGQTPQSMTLVNRIQALEGTVASAARAHKEDISTVNKRLNILLGIVVTLQTSIIGMVVYHCLNA